MKLNRQDKILELILSHKIGTQEELAELLAEHGIKATQATISRDIRELKITKEMEGGGWRYVAKSAKGPYQFPGKAVPIFSQSVVSVDVAMNLTVVKCRTGMANAACAVLDGMQLPGVVGTIAGDDTILIILKTEAEAKTLTKEIYKLITK